MNNLIMLGHKARQGKDALIDDIVENPSIYGIDNVKKFKFAGALRDEVNGSQNLITYQVWVNGHKVLVLKPFGQKKIVISNRHKDWNKLNCDSLVEILMHLIVDLRAPFMEFERKTRFNKITLNEFNEDKFRETFPYMMKILQWWGTDFRRSDNENYWVDQTLWDLAEWFYELPEDQNNVALISDCRFESELLHEHLDDVEVAYVDIRRWNEDGTRYIDQDRKNHQSEIDIDKYYDKFVNVINTNPLPNHEEVVKSLRLSFQALGSLPIKNIISI